MRKPRVAEIFSGAGLFGAAFKRAGFETVYAADANWRAVKSFNRNVAQVAEVRDVRDVRRDIRCDILVAGPPCQGFSTLGRRNPRDVRNALSLTIAEWAAALIPRVIVVENVPRYLESVYARRLRISLLTLGYEACEWILCASDYGAPQLRTRSFSIYSREGLPAAPRHSRSSARTVRDAFRGLSAKPDRSGMHVAPAPSPIALSRFLRIPERGDKRDVIRRAPHLCPPSWMRMGIEATDVWGRLDYDKPANTLRCDFQNASKGRYVHPTAHRVITLREGARLQGVPDHWEFEGMRAHVAAQLGNGVPLQLGGAVARSLRRLF